MFLKVLNPLQLKLKKVMYIKLYTVSKVVDAHRYYYSIFTRRAVSSTVQQPKEVLYEDN